MDNKYLLSNRSSTKAKCGCMKTAHGVRRVAREGCPDDDDAVAALPDDWVPRHSGPILANYLIQREVDHKNIHEDIIKCAEVVNRDIDDKIQFVAKNLLDYMYKNQLEMDCVVDKYGRMKLTLTEDARNEALKCIHKLSLQRVGEMTSFKRDASALEHERADKLKKIMRDNFQRFMAVGHMTPKELLHNFDERIYEINQQLLSNSRAFVELEAQLRFQLDESVINARSSLNQLNLGVTVVYRGRDSVSAVCNSKIDIKSQRRSVSADREVSDNSIRRTFLEDVEELDACIQRVVQAYRTAVLKVYTGFCDKLNDLENDLCGHYVVDDVHQIHLCEFTDFQNLIERPLRRLSTINSSSSKTLLEITGADVISMQKSLWSLGECLQNTYLILHHAGHLWDAHILRFAFVQKLTMAAVEDLITSHDAIALSNEIQFSIAVDQLRWAPDVDKLQQQYDIITGLLAKTTELYFQQSEAELGRLEEFMNLPAHLANILLSEFDVFLEKYPRSLVSTDKGNSQPSSPKRSPSQFRLPLPRAILQTELQELALRNWKNGFLESFEHNISLVPAELRRQAELWVEERCTFLHMRYSLKAVSHSVRMERVKAAKETRFAELRYHESRLESHLLAINDLVDSLPMEASEFAAIDAPFLYPFVEWVNRIKANIEELLAQEAPNPVSKKLKMTSYAIRLPKHRYLFEKSLDKGVTEYKLHLEQRVQEARISNVRFISQIKLFNEGGRYAVQEAIKTSSVLSKASESLETCIHKALEALNHRRSQLLAYADNLLLPVTRMLDDLSKIVGKSSVREQDKRKPPGKKK